VVVDEDERPVGVMLGTRAALSENIAAKSFARAGVLRLGERAFQQAARADLRMCAWKPT
jgi:hypothetical protein